MFKKKQTTMKKFLLSFSLILAFVISAEAQPYHRTRPHHDYYYSNIGEARLHIAGELGIADPVGLFWHKAPRHYSIGAMGEIQVGRRLSLGLGAEFCGTLDHTYYNNPVYYNSVPVYGNIRLSSPGYGTKVFVEARVGYAIPTNTICLGSPESYYETRGLFTGAGIGINCFNNNISIGVNAIDVTSHYGPAPMNEGPGRRRVISNCYLRYSYAIPLN